MAGNDLMFNKKIKEIARKTSKADCNHGQFCYHGKADCTSIRQELSSLSFKY